MAVDHPIFTRVYGVVAEVGERTGLGRVRRRVLSSATGRLLIVGLGPGHDLDHLPPAVTSIVALEPSESMRAAARARIRTVFDRGIDIDVMAASAEHIPLPDDSVDTALVAYVLCSVEDPAGALREIHRVLRPGGDLLVLEHVREDDRGWRQHLQRTLEPMWPRCAGGCHLDRDTRRYIATSGFDVGGLSRVRLRTLPPVSLTLIGTAPSLRSGT